MNSGEVRLIEPTVELKSEFVAMVEEYTSDEQAACQYDKAIEDFGKYVQERLDWKSGRSLPDGWVPASIFWLVRSDNVILGVSSLRHELTDHLRRIGGHIGYNIRPSQRRRGYGAAILALTLKEARKVGLKKALVTCDDDNIASVKIIEKNGGKLEDIYTDSELTQPKRRHWIEL